MFAALESARLRFLPCFSGENRGETGALVPLFAASLGIIAGTRQTKLACVEHRVSLPFRWQGRILPCRRSPVTAPLDHQSSEQYGRIANEPDPARRPFANLPCRQGKLGKAVGVDVAEGDDAAAFARAADGRLDGRARTGKDLDFTGASGGNRTRTPFLGNGF
jgi:hypothetical protein